MLRRVLALTDTASTIGLVLVFFVVFPLLAHVLIGFSIAQVLGERHENKAYKKRADTQP